MQKQLDNTYSEDMKNNIIKELKEQMNNFERYFIKELRPYGVNSETLKKINKEWDDLFEGKEIIPKVCLNKIIDKNNPFEIKKYLVPIS